MVQGKFGAFPTHPGEIVKDEIEYRKISQRKLAEDMGMSYYVISDVLNAKRPVNASLAYLFEAVLGISAEVLLRLQVIYDMQTAQADKKFMARLASIRKVAAML